MYLTKMEFMKKAVELIGASKEQNRIEQEVKDKV